MAIPVKRARVFITLFVIVILIGGTVIAINFAKGYRPSFGKKITIKGTGLLSATSYPKSAQIFIDDHLTAVTDTTLYLNPQTYELKIIKAGFHVWSKSVPVKPELVTLADARLFPSIPSVSPLTFYQASHTRVSPDGNRVAYVLSGSPFKQDNGVYALSLSSSLLGNQITQIADQSVYDYSKAELIWSPDSNQILAIFRDGTKITASHLLNSHSMNQTKNLIDTTIRLSQTLSQWQDQLIKVNQNNIAHFPEFFTGIATQSAVNVYFSPDKEKVFYTATQNLELPENLIGKNLSTINSTVENRKLETGKSYVFDSKEGTNYLVFGSTYTPDTSVRFLLNPSQLITPTPTIPLGTKRSIVKQTVPEKDPLSKQISLIRGQFDPFFTQNLSWYSTSSHIISVSESGVSITEYDGNNSIQIMSGSITERFAAGAPDGNHLIILSNINQKPEVFNLFSLDLK